MNGQPLPDPPDPESDIWITRDKRQIPIAQMDDSHLLNTIRFLERNCVNHAELPYPTTNGEMAQYYAEIEYAEALGRPAFPAQYERMLAEAERRGLDT